MVISSSLRATAASNSDPSSAILKLPKLMDRPPGCSFLGSKATEVEVHINNFASTVCLIFDSGSDITLISEKTYDSLRSKNKIRQGQKINLIQVTGKTTISGYVPLSLYFKTSEGSVELRVEAYVVQGMSTPLILGNDFADQYALSLICRDTQTFLQFGSSGRETEVFNSVGTPYVDDEGHAFQISAQHRPGMDPSRKLRCIKAKRKRRQLLAHK